MYQIYLENVSPKKGGRMEAERQHEQQRKRETEMSTPKVNNFYLTIPQ